MPEARTHAENGPRRNHPGAAALAKAATRA